MSIKKLKETTNKSQKTNRQLLNCTGINKEFTQLHKELAVIKEILIIFISSTRSKRLFYSIGFTLNCADAYKKKYMMMEQRIRAYKSSIINGLDCIQARTLKDSGSIECTNEVEVVSMKLAKLNERIEMTTLLYNSGLRRMKMENSSKKSEVSKPNETIKERDRLKKENQELSNKITVFNKQLNELHIKAENDRNTYNEKTNELIRLNNQLEQTYNEVKAEYEINIKALNDELTSNNTTIKELTMNCKELEDCNKDLSNKLAKDKEEFKRTIETLKDQIKSKESTEFKEQIEKIKKENELRMQYHLKENNETLKKYSLENARLIVSMEKISMKIKKFSSEYNKIKKEIKKSLVSFVELFTSLNLIVQGKIDPPSSSLNKSYFNITYAII